VPICFIKPASAFNAKFSNVVSHNGVNIFAEGVLK
jgi:hypothetical protein